MFPEGQSHGIVKTRLAQEIVRIVEVHFAGVSSLDLTDIRDSAHVKPLLTQGVEALVAVARDSAHPASRILLFVDNFEQVVEAATAVQDIVQQYPQLTVLLTSRIALRVRGEYEIAVNPLPVPSSATDPNTDELIHNPAVALFVERARAVQRGFTLSATTAADIADICMRLDGLPLAIELAASRLRVLALPELRARLDQRLSLLTGGDRDLPERQQTMRTAIALSYELLPPQEQRIFQDLSIFRHGWTLDAATAVCEAADELAMVNVLSSLRDQSLIVHEDRKSGSRYRMLETIRAYALEQLEASGRRALIEEQYHSRFA